MATKTSTRVQPPAIATRALDLLERGYERNVSAVESASKAIAGRLPELPALPFAPRLPEPERVVRETYAAFERLARIQRDYALKMLKAFKPVRTKVVHRQTEAA